jgi:uncharacterized membrane protein
MFLLVAALAILCGVLPWIVVGVALADRRELRALRARVEELERAAGLFAGGSVPPPMRAGHDPRATAPLPAAPLPAAPVPATAPNAPARLKRDTTRLEEQVGAIWMQNVGSVLLLLGAFFLIVWGYAMGRIGPEVLVLAGVALGIVLVWRGAIIARTLVPLGNALIGVGLGVVYITLYLGHFRMYVLSGWGAFTLLSLVSLITVAVGLRRREPIIATLGVLGAHLPQLVAVEIPLQGFRLAAPTLLGYFAVVNATVLILAATIGWSGLVIFCLGMTSLTWCASVQGPWGFGIQLSLTALFTLLGLAPVVRHVRSPSPVRSVDLAVVAIAPVLLLVSSIPFLAADRVRAAEFLLGVAAVYAVASGWVGSIRKEEDLWKPLTAAATVYLAAALERGLLSDYLALAWCAEGAALVWLGLWRGGGWLRFLGYLILGLSTLKLLAGFLVSTWSGGRAFAEPLEAEAIRDLLCVAAFILISHAIGRRKDRLAPEERHVPGLSVVVSNLLLMVWIAFEARPIASYTGALAPVLTSAGWSLQALALFALGWIRESAFLRWCGFVLFGVTVLKFLLVDLDRVDAFWRFASAVGIGIVLLGISFLYQRRARRRTGSRAASA